MRSFRWSYVLQPSMHVKNMSWFTSESTSLVAYSVSIRSEKQRHRKMSSVHILFLYCMFSFSTPHVCYSTFINNNEKRFFPLVLRIHFQMTRMLFGSRTVCDYNCRVTSKVTGSTSYNKETALAQTNVRWPLMMEYQRGQVPIATLVPSPDRASNPMEESD